jgi:phosphoglycerate dehydrogenase-like enzyme
MKILVAAYSPFPSWCLPDADYDRLVAQLPEHTIVRARSDAETLEKIGDADVFFGMTLRPEQFAAARRLKWVHSPAAGLGPMLFPEMIASPIPMTNSRGNSSRAIAEHVIAVTLALWRQLPLAFRQQSERVWDQDPYDSGATFRLIRGARVLIVGIGSIGAETARLFTALGAHVVGVRRRADGDPIAGVASVVPVERLHDELPQADVVVIAAPHTPATIKQIGARELDLMKRDAVLVSVSRGTLVDENALFGALRAGRIRGAALDVTEQEPLPADSPLWGLPNVLMTPHVSGFHATYWSEVVAIFTDNLRRFLDGRPLVNVVDKRAGY